jgi:hypothetical protein
MSLLPCDLDPLALGIVVDGRWSLEALRDHVQTCRDCTLIRWSFAAITGGAGGRAGRGPLKRRGDANYYRALANRSWSK